MCYRHLSLIKETCVCTTWLLTFDRPIKNVFHYTIQRFAVVRRRAGLGVNVSTTRFVVYAQGASRGKNCALGTSLFIFTIFLESFESVERQACLWRFPDGPTCTPSFSFQFLVHEGLIKVSGKGWWVNSVALTNQEGTSRQLRWSPWAIGSRKVETLG